MTFVGVGIRKNRYKNCSIRIYRRTFSRDLTEKDDSISTRSSLMSDSNSEGSLRGIEIILVCALLSNKMALK